jgi:hypothetical protein
VISDAQSTILEDCFSSVDAVLGQVTTILEDCFLAVDAVFGTGGYRLGLL